MKTLLAAAGAALALAYSQLPAHSAGATAYLFLKINDQAVQGEATGRGAAGGIELVGFDETAFRNTAGGREAGPVTYRPLQVTKRSDKTSPLLWQAFATGQKVEATIKFFQVNKQGVDVQYYTVVLTQAAISGLREHAGIGDDAGTWQDVEIAFQSISTSLPNEKGATPLRRTL